MQSATEPRGPGASEQHSMFVPVLLVVIALLLMTGFQMIQLTREHDLLKSRLEMLAGPLQESRNVREQMQSVAASTAILAARGNENAAKIVEQLQKAGVTINTDDPQ